MYLGDARPRHWATLKHEVWALVLAVHLAHPILLLVTLVRTVRFPITHLVLGYACVVSASPGPGPAGLLSSEAGEDGGHQDQSLGHGC